MKVYRRETSDIVRRFLAHQIDYRECIASLDAALASAVLRTDVKNMAGIRGASLINNNIIIKEMQRRGQIVKGLVIPAT